MPVAVQPVKAEERRPSILETIMAGSNGAGPEHARQEPSAAQILARTMFDAESDDLILLTRLNTSQADALFNMIETARVTGYKRLGEAAKTMMGLYVSMKGQGRVEGTGMAHAYNFIGTQTPTPTDKALQY